MVWLPDDEKNSKISLFVFAQLMNATDRQTPHHGIYRAYAYASRGKNHPILIKFGTLQQIMNPMIVT